MYSFLTYLIALPVLGYLYIRTCDMRIVRFCDTHFDDWFGTQICVVLLYFVVYVVPGMSNFILNVFIFCRFYVCVYHDFRVMQYTCRPSSKSIVSLLEQEKGLNIPKRLSEPLKRRGTDNTITKSQMTKNTNIEQQNTTQKTTN